jgi:hypothetical protein
MTKMCLDVFGWDVKEHRLAMMPSEKRWKKKDVFGMDVKTTLVHIFPLHSTATVYCNTLELVVAGVP